MQIYSPFPSEKTCCETQFCAGLIKNGVIFNHIRWIKIMNKIQNN